ncbi:hypothetical protein TNCV_3780111 [Trichonephila clavipes]|nr:hypothetical protein TNCV_3780111 [Trichonephila clavipes]
MTSAPRENGRAFRSPVWASKGERPRPMSSFFLLKENIIDADSDDENEMNDAVLVPTSSEIRNVMKNMLSYLSALSNGEMINKMYDAEQLVDNLMLKNNAK